MSLDQLIKKDVVAKACTLGISVGGTKTNWEREFWQRRRSSAKFWSPNWNQKRKSTSAPQIRHREAGNAKILSEHNCRKRKRSRSYSYSSCSSESESDSSSSSSVSDRRSRSRGKKRYSRNSPETVDRKQTFVVCFRIGQIESEGQFTETSSVFVRRCAQRFEKRLE